MSAHLTEPLESPEPEATYAPTYWRVIEAINGRGDLAVGPDAWQLGWSAIVFAPPGVLLRSASSPPTLTREGWRRARWGVDRHGHVLIDQAQPFELHQLSLADTVSDIAAKAPQLLSWVAARVENHLAHCVSRIVPDYRGVRHPAAESATHMLFKLRREADEAFGSLDRDLVGEAGWFMQERAFTSLVEGYLVPIHARPAPVAHLRHRGAPPPPAPGTPHLRIVE